MFLFGMRGGNSCQGGMSTPNMTRRGAGKRPGVQASNGPSARCAAILLQEKPLPGPDAPTTARAVGLPPRGGQYFLSKRKKVPKKARGTATTGKSPLLPIFERGSSQCRAQHCWIVITYYRARSCSLFSSFKKGKAFSLRCLSPLCFPAVGAGQAQISGAWSISL